jgi:hypothetical protein
VRARKLLKQAHTTCALTATIQKIRNGNCFCVLDTDQKSTHHFAWRPPHSIRQALLVP